jgi:DNA-binding NarL/FixJ family response regulator
MVRLRAALHTASMGTVSIETASADATRAREAASRSVFIAEDSRIVRARLVAMLDETGGVAVVGQAETAQDAVQGILDTRPDWVLLDLQLIGGSGIEVLRRVRSRVPQTKFIVLTNLSTPQYRRVCLEAGADHFLDKTQAMTVRDVIAGPRQNAQGEPLC